MISPVGFGKPAFLCTRVGGTSDLCDFGDSLENRGTVRVMGVPMADARLSLRCVFGDHGSDQSSLTPVELCSGRCVLVPSCSGRKNVGCYDRFVA